MAKEMKKATKVWISVFVGVIVVMVLLYSLFAMLWNGAFNKKDVRDIGTYESPDGNYSLIFQQVGDPHWSFGPTNVRLVLKDSEQKTIDAADTKLMHDGVNASTGNIKFVEWKSDSVIIILQASEMEDKEVKIMLK